MYQHENNALIVSYIESIDIEIYGNFCLCLSALSFNGPQNEKKCSMCNIRLTRYIYWN